MKIKKKYQKRICFLLMLFIILGNAICIVMGQSVVYGKDMISIDTAASAALTGIASVLAFFYKFVIYFVGKALQTLINAVAIAGTGNTSVNVSIENILFAGCGGKIGTADDIRVLSVNFFESISQTEDATVYTFRTAIAKWYYIIRLIAASALLVILIYVGIRMALSTVATEEAKYKKMLVDWVTSIALLFVLHYIIIFILTINTSFIKALSKLLTNTASGKTAGQALTDAISDKIWGFSDNIQGLFCAIIYVIIEGESIMFLIYYLKRMVTVGFLIMIAPLITITYSIDKIGDGKAQALNAWLKELVYNILIQPFHCILYLSFFDAVTQLIDTNTDDLMPYILAIIIILFIHKAEQILKKIFHFESQSMGGLSESTKGFMAATGAVARVGSKVGRGTVKFAKGTGGVVKSGVKGTMKGVNNAKAFASMVKDQAGEKQGIGKLGSVGSAISFMRTDEGKSSFSAKKEHNSEVWKSSWIKRKQTSVSNYLGGGNSSRRERKIEENMKSQTYTDSNGKTMTYDEVKQAAKDGSKPEQQKAAQQMLTGARSKAEKEVPKTTIQSARGFVKNHKKGIKTASTVAKDMFRTGAGMATAAFMTGVGGANMQNVSMGYQAGEGIMRGIFEETSAGKTVMKQGTDVLAKSMALSGKTADEMPEHLKAVKVNGDTGFYDNLDKKFDDFLTKVTRLLNGNRNGAEDFVSKMKLGIADPNRDFDLNALVKGLNIQDPEVETQLLSESGVLAEEFADKQSYVNMQKAEELGFNDTDEYISKLVKQVNKKTINYVNYNITQEVNEENSNNLDPSHNVGFNDNNNTQNDNDRNEE